MDQPSLISKLQGIRNTLLDSVTGVEQLERKFVGARPSDQASKPGGNPQNVDILTSEILTLACQINKLVANQHGIVGDFSEGISQAQPAYSR